MKPRTKLDFRIKALSDKLLPLTAKQRDSAKRNCFPQRASVRKNGTAYCLECGYEWKLNAKFKKRLVCPSCREKLAAEITLERMKCNEGIFAMLHVIEGMQVVRLFYINKLERIKERAHYFINEIAQQWYIDEQKRVIVGRGTRNQAISHGSKLEIRKEATRYGYQMHLYDYIPDYVVPGWHVLPILKRNGFSGDFHGASPKELIRQLPYSSLAETLLKSKQYSLFASQINGRCHVRNWWASIRICLRNNYIVKDAAMWCDYIDLLSYFGKDLHNAKYVCPKNLKAEHDRLVQKKRILIECQEAEAKRKKAIADEKRFNELKSAFFGLCFSAGDLRIQMIDSVGKIYEEGDVMHHCVATNNYHLKSDSLILSATIEGKRIETVEVSLKELKVVQSRGVCNSTTEHHDRIVKLVNKNIKLIKQRIKNGDKNSVNA